MTGTGSAMTSGRYDQVAIALHWTIASLIILNIPLGALSETIEQAIGTSPVALHKSIGLTVLALSLVRLLWRLTHRPPPLPPEIAPWRRRGAALVHWAFYLLIIAVPLTGWLRTSAGRYPLTWFGLVDIPKFPLRAGTLEAAAAANAHELLAWAMVLLILVHVAAALHHQFVLRDRLLARMLPKAVG